MSVTEPQRHQLYQAIKQRLGESEAETFMNLMPPDWADLATKADLQAMETRVLRTMGTWLFTSQAVLVAVVGSLVAVFG